MARLGGRLALVIALSLAARFHQSQGGEPPTWYPSVPPAWIDKELKQGHPLHQALWRAYRRQLDAETSRGDPALARFSGPAPRLTPIERRGDDSKYHAQQFNAAIRAALGEGLLATRAAWFVARMLAHHENPRIRDPAAALRLLSIWRFTADDPRYCAVEAAYLANAQEFLKAAIVAGRGARLARQSGDHTLAQELEQHRRGYEAGLTWQPSAAAGTHSAGPLGTRRPLAYVMDALAVSLRTTGNHAEAVACWEQALRADPGYLPARRRVARSRLQQSRYPEAAEHLLRLVALEEHDLEALTDLGTAFFESGRPELAETCWREVLRLDTGQAEAANCLAWHLALRSGHRSPAAHEALRWARRACAAAPSNPRYLDTLGAACAAAGHFHEARQAAERAARLAPDHGLSALAAPFARRAALYQLGLPYRDECQARLALGLACIETRPAEAAEHFLAVLDIDPHHSTALLELAIVRERQGHVGEALDLYSAALDARPEWDRALNNLAWILATHPQVQWRSGSAALQFAQRACAAAPTSPEYLDTLAAAYAEVGQFDQAMSTVQRALELLRGSSPGADTLRSILHERQAHYRAGRPWREGHAAAGR